MKTTDLIHVSITFEDLFSFAKVTKQTTVSGLSYKQIEEDINRGKTFKHFDKVQQISSTYKILSIKQTT